MKTLGGDQPMFHLGQLSMDVLCLPHSSADCERVFSSVAFLKTRLRNSLFVRTVRDLLTVREYLLKHGGIQTFEPTAAMMDHFNSRTMYGRRQQRDLPHGEGGHRMEESDEDSDDYDDNNGENGENVNADDGSNDPNNTNEGDGDEMFFDENAEEYLMEIANPSGVLNESH